MITIRLGIIFGVVFALSSYRLAVNTNIRRAGGLPKPAQHLSQVTGAALGPTVLWPPRHARSACRRCSRWWY